ncbi:unnamed protein product [Ranitomeya imitator]|uniref:WD repeat protein mio zinc-ribbon like domain-containing protein n=1 Tax=Ranitomeya imitator TaxID=111125 RepID=A0ABN9M6V1_9NEOB|nr:unnamed protein product [Ranitomeya imitator]
MMVSSSLNFWIMYGRKPWERSISEVTSPAVKARPGKDLELRLARSPLVFPVPSSLTYTAEESASTANLREMIRTEVRESLRSMSQAGSSKQRASVISDSSEEDKEEGSFRSNLSSSSSEEESGRFCLPLDRVDKLVKSVRGTMGLEEPKTQLSRQELMFSGLEHKKRRSFPVIDKIQDLILREWKKPEKKGSLPPALKRRYPFEDTDVDTWDKAPKLDAAVAKASKKAALPFEDMGSLKDPLDRKAEIFLKVGPLVVFPDDPVLLPLKGSPSDVLRDERVQYWIENYRNLLDAWRFWHKRAEFDIHRSKLDPSSKPLAQVEMLDPCFWSHFVMESGGEQQQLPDEVRQKPKQKDRGDQPSRKSSSEQGSRASTNKEPPRIPVLYFGARVAEESVTPANLRDMIRLEVRESLRSLSQAEGSKHRTLLDSNSSEEEREENTYLSSPLSSSSDEESGRFCLPLDKIDKVVKSVRGTMGIEEPKSQPSKQELMFSGLDRKKHRSFPVNEKIQDLILREWKKPEKKGALPPALKRRYPFDDPVVDTWDKAPKLDAAVAKASKKASLPFEDMGTLKDPLDRKADIFLKGTWEMAAGSLRPAVAATCTARSLMVWLDQLESQLKDGASRDTILKALPTIQNAAAFLSDASVDLVRMAARAAGLSNAARRALWLKCWSGDIQSRTKLCAIPCEGQYLFGPTLDELLEKAGDDKKKFPNLYSSYRRPFNRRRFGRGKKRGSSPTRESFRWEDRRGRGKPTACTDSLPHRYRSYRLTNTGATASPTPELLQPSTYCLLPHNPVECKGRVLAPLYQSVVVSLLCSSVPHQGRGFSQYGVSGSPTKSKFTSCPGCRKPLPRCALCLINMGNPISSCPGASKSDEKVDLSKEKKVAQFNNWFTWCHNCRHGGHAGHMMSWFNACALQYFALPSIGQSTPALEPQHEDQKRTSDEDGRRRTRTNSGTAPGDHTECPVSACSCKCMQLDTTGNLVPAETAQP